MTTRDIEAENAAVEAALDAWDKDWRYFEENGDLRADMARAIAAYSAALSPPSASEQGSSEKCIRFSDLKGVAS